MPHKSRTAPCAAAEGRTRFRTAQAYLEVAKSVLDERDRDEYLNVAAGLAVFSGVAASRLGPRFGPGRFGGAATCEFPCSRWLKCALRLARRLALCLSTCGAFVG
jgi:hypothetical protein